jgi:hypothetical protein
MKPLTSARGETLGLFRVEQVRDQGSIDVGDAEFDVDIHQ